AMGAGEESASVIFVVDLDTCGPVAPLENRSRNTRENKWLHFEGTGPRVDRKWPCGRVECASNRGLVPVKEVNILPSLKLANGLAGRRGFWHDAARSLPAFSCGASCCHACRHVHAGTCKCSAGTFAGEDDSQGMPVGARPGDHPGSGQRAAGAEFP